ncbi:hypothetical protein OF829_02565 [Sphingomonas sp. LB-2]|uniref:hypothetical protein n=1 Tax=Sphingomonas caeni TaxID=2984949 RepID=UPI00222FA7EE|nr:hypothetical protein [Sphingomonas caeni]MCW3846104.1 hypothetical protein [Sphingomonas caeni]
MQDYLWIATVALLLLAVAAGLGEWRRRKRRDFDAVGFMPWALIQVVALIAAAGMAVLAMQN